MLEDAGLTKAESKIYETLIKIGPSFAGKIAKKSGLHRRTTYDSLDKLIEKGLVSYIVQNNKHLFKAENPKKILDFLEEKKENLIPYILSLEEKYPKDSNTKETYFFKGLNGLKSVFESQLEEKEILILGANEDASDILKFYFNWYNKKRVSKKINTKVIAYSKELLRMKNVQIKFLPEKYNNPVAINIYGSKTAIILWSKDPLAIVIDDQEVTQGFKKHFELMWKIAKP